MVSKASGFMQSVKEELRLANAQQPLPKAPEQVRVPKLDFQGLVA